MKLEQSLYAILRRILSEINEQVVDHGDRVAYLYLKLAEYRGYQDNQYFENMMLACYGHDIGAYKTEKFLDLLKFDVKNTQEHCIYGYLFMKYFSPIADDAEVLLYHHTYYSHKDEYDSKYVDDGILIHLLDRIDIFNLKHSDESDVLWQIKNGAGNNFNPKDVEDFILANEKYHIIESLRDGTYKVDVINYFNKEERTDRLLNPIINMLAYEIDFRSEQTVIHSITTSHFSKTLAQKLNLSEEQIDEVRWAGQIHDLGKVNVEKEIVDKKGKLTPEEYHQMKKHVLYTELIVNDIFPKSVVRIAARHHERLDGSGYPRQLKAKDLTICDRLLEVADVASALLQRRSYKDSLDKKIVIDILKQESDNGKLDSEIVELFINNYDEIINEAMASASNTITNYENLQKDYKKYSKEYSNDEIDAIEEFGLFADLLS